MLLKKNYWGTGLARPARPCDEFEMDLSNAMKYVVPIGAAGRNDIDKLISPNIDDPIPAEKERIIAHLRVLFGNGIAEEQGRYRLIEVRGMGSENLLVELT